ncbi:serine/threonine protein kinase [Micromonospora sp. CPCC 206061]|uniref:serine/threonine protein kinase n=1 Tax=Micromonospora sp. CPCC 206061 TaxID=3122410 RepID=UPI002FF43641
MTGEPGSRTAPLRPSDPERLGRYELLGRLGEGGMGTVYLARAADGKLVALKVVRADVLDDEFRRRFRSEVNRARQVPPFCTAEVLDADPDHERPYLVVEYVDAPNLSTVVEERGPLSPANLHSFAIGVATALTAIHGAGVIHRDLKPSNVLLAPGSPKVIDFGIARAVEPTSRHTDTNQMLGTVAYMAPERFGPDAGTEITQAADVFAWGAVVAYAGTGRTPFAADSPPVIAARILTQPPNLTGLVPPIRDLVERALSKTPTERPTARELLDLLLGATSDRSPELAAALDRQPALRVAAEEAQAATEPHASRHLTAAAAPAYLADVAAGETEPAARVAPAAGDETPALAAIGFCEPAPAAPPVAPTRGGRSGRIAVLAVALAVLVTSLTVAGVATGVLPLGRIGGPSAGGASPSATGATASAAPSAPAASPTVVSPPPSKVVLLDPLTEPSLWPTRDEPVQLATCGYDGGLVVTRGKQGPYRCRGPMDQYTDFIFSVDVRLLTEGSCAGMWFRFAQNAGYLARICPEGFYVATHGVNDAAEVTVLRTMPFITPIALDTKTRIAITVRGSSIALDRDGYRIGELTDATFAQGRIVLGIYPELTEHQPPFEVAFTNVEVRAITG